MGSFLAIFAIACVVVFALICLVAWLMEKEKKEPEFKAKMDKLRTRLDPRIHFFENLFLWVFVIAVIYFIYLG
jgi:hypothetical protein